MTIAIYFTEVSSNQKVGPIPVTTSSRETCDPACAFYDAGCYADYGPMKGLWRNMTKAGANAFFANGKNTLKTIDWQALCARIANLKDGSLWRHNQAGDLPRDASGAIDSAMVAQLTKANNGKNGFTYTHHNVLQNAGNKKTIKNANDNGFTINLSGNNPAHADALADLNIAPVVTVLPSSLGRMTNKAGEYIESVADYKARIGDIKTPKGRAIAPCPATYLETNCKACGLCQKQSRKVIVGFPAHGAAKSKINALFAS